MGHAPHECVPYSTVFLSASPDVLNDLLNYDKIETGQLQLEKSILNFAELLVRVVHEFELPYNAKGITLQVPDLELVLPPCPKARSIVGDSMKITQVIRNLLSNALKVSNSSSRALYSST